MSVISELIRSEADGTLSFGNYELESKSKKQDFEHQGDLYKVKTFKEITKLERNAGALSRISRMIGDGMDNRAIADVALQGIPYDIFDELEVGYRCNCSRQRMDAVMASLGRAQVEKLLAEQVAEGKPEELEIVCRFCGNRYRYSRAELEKLPFSKA